MASPPFTVATSTPADNDIVAQYPLAERTFRDQVNSWLQVDHNTSGQHAKATMVEQSSAPTTPAAGVSVLYADTNHLLYLKRTDGTIHAVGNPPGTIIHFAGSVTPPGYLVADGSAVSRSTFFALFAAIGTAFGAGDGSTTFNLPDLRGRVLASPDNMGGGTDPNRLTSGALASVRNSVGGAGGEAGHTLITSELPTTVGSTVATVVAGPTFSYDTTPHSNGGAGGFNAVGPGQIAQSGLPAVVQTTNINMPVINVTNAGGGAAHNIMQPTLLVNAYIKY